MAIINGDPGLAWLTAGKPRVVFRFEIEADTVRGIELIADRATLDTLTLTNP